MSENPAAMDRREKRAAVRRLLMYWGNISRARRDNETRISEIEQEIAALYDVQAQQFTGMPHGTSISDPTYHRATCNTSIIAGLHAEKALLQEENARFDRDGELIRHEVLCLPPLESEVIELRYCRFGYAKKDYWARIAARVHVSVDNAKKLERKGVDELTKHITVKLDTIGHE